MKFSTINQVVEALLSAEPQSVEEKIGDKLLKITMTSQEDKANQANILWKTFLICENQGIDRAMEYYNGTHSDDEYKEFKTGVIDELR